MIRRNLGRNSFFITYDTYRTEIHRQISWPKLSLQSVGQNGHFSLIIHLATPTAHFGLTQAGHPQNASLSTLPVQRKEGDWLSLPTGSVRIWSDRSHPHGQVVEIHHDSKKTVPVLDYLLCLEKFWLISASGFQHSLFLSIKEKNLLSDTFCLICPESISRCLKS